MGFGVWGLGSRVWGLRVKEITVVGVQGLSDSRVLFLAPPNTL